MNLANKVAIVTGSARGIGKAIAVKLSEQEAAVVFNDVSDAVNSAADELKAMNRPSLAVVADISTAEGANKLIDAAVAAFGRVDILVNNAGITRDGLLMRMSDEDWDKVLAVDLKSVFLCTRAVVRHMMKQRWGRIINISSVVGIVGNPGQANYASAKAGIIGFTKSISKEVASRGITVNAIAPGFIDTEMTQKLSEEWRQKLKSQIPAGVLGEPRDIAEAVAFLASEEARYITGQVLGVDGGMAGSWM
jgi:3-oxoacyl-[acyl-carrier protein] reductase